MKFFSLAWKASGKPGKQRKYRANAPLHVKRNFLTAALSKELGLRLGVKKITVRKGDSVKVQRGEFRGFTGKIGKVNVKDGLVFVDGVERVRKDGTKSFSPIRPSSLLLVDLSIEDKRRAASLARKSKSAVVAEKKTAAKSKQTKNVKS